MGNTPQPKRGNVNGVHSGQDFAKKPEIKKTTKPARKIKGV